MHIQPDEGTTIRVASKIPGPLMRVRSVNMDFRYGTSFGVEPADAYERLLLDAMLGDSTLFTRRDEVEEAWELVNSILEGWEEEARLPTAAVRGRHLGAGGSRPVDCPRWAHLAAAISPV